nr:M56 family metallopeptidase [Neiella litorisoli]
MPGDELLAQADLESTLAFGRQVKVKITLASQPGMATGLFSPVIWLNQHFSQSKHVNNILLHELTHLRQFDPLLKWLAAFSKRVFWWNPVVKWIVDTLELVIEVNCDQICYQKNREKYRISLAEIIWQQNQAQQLHNTAGMAGIATIHHANSVNIKRLKALEVEKKMKFSYLLVAGMSLFMTTLACAHLNSRGLAPVTERLHAKAIHFKNQRAKQPPMPVFLPRTEANSEYNRQIQQLIELSQSALSADVDELDQLFHLIKTWDANRAALGAPESKNDYFATNNSLEKRMVMQVVSILHFLLQQQDKSSEIVALLGRYFPEPERMPQFYRHHLARAYLRLADARKATEIMQLFDYSSEKIRPNTISMMVRAFVEDGQYEKALEIVEQRLAMTPASTQLQYLKYGVLIESSDYAGAEQVSHLLQQQDKKISNPLTRELSMLWSPVLDHI